MVKFIIKIADIYRDKIVVNGWKSLQSLYLKTVIFFSGKAKFMAVKFIKIKNTIFFKSSIDRTLKQGFIKLIKAFSITTSVPLSAVKYITKMPADMSVTGAVKIYAYKIFTSLMGSNIGFVSKMGFSLYLLFFPKTNIGVGVTINDNLLTSKKFIKTQTTFATGGMMKVKSNNLPFYLKHLDPIKLNDMDRYTLKELDGNI